MQWVGGDSERAGDALQREAFRAVLAVVACPRWRSLPCTAAVRFSVEAQATRGRMAVPCPVPGDQRSPGSPQCLAELDWWHVLGGSVCPSRLSCQGDPNRAVLTRLTSL